MFRKILMAATLLAGAAHADELRTWKHGIIEPKSDAGFAIMPLQERFTAPYGLKVEIINIQSDQIGLKSLIAGQMDSYEGAPNSGIVAATHGADVKVVACAWPQLVQGIFVRDDIKDLADLRGHNIAISAPGSMPDMVMRAALKQVGVPASEVKFASLGSDADRFKSLSVGIVSGAVVSTEFSTVAPKDVRLLKPLREVYPEFLRGCIVTSGDNLAKRHNDAAGLVAAEITGLRYAVAHRDETIALTQQVTHAKADDPRAAFIFDESVKHGDLDPEMHLDVAKVAWMQTLLAEVGSVTKPLEVGKLVDTSVRADALKLVK